ncbi:MAG: glutamyl-tRNA reductase [Acidimicrobiales bacterium]
MALICVGVDHEHASLDLLERATLPEHEWAKVVRILVAQANVDQAVLVSTCLRTEVVAVVDRFHGALDDVTAVLAEATGVDPAELAAHLSVHFDRGVPAHLFAVAAGLRSVVPGEYEVLGQLRRALDLAVEEGTAGRELTELFRAALASGRRARASTALSRGTVSFARAAVELARDDLGADVAGATCVVVGAGQLGAGVTRGLLELPVARVVVLNRSPERARDLAASLGDARVDTGGLDQLARRIGEARVLVTAVETPVPVVSASDLDGRATALLVVDLAVPRAVDVHADAIPGVTRRDLSDLRERVERVLDERHGAIEAARDVVEHDVARHLDDQRARAAAGIVTDLRARLDADVAEEFARRAGELSRLDDSSRRLLDDVVRSVVAKVAHRPTVALRDAAGTERAQRLSEAARTLFDL